MLSTFGSMDKRSLSHAPHCVGAAVDGPETTSHVQTQAAGLGLGSQPQPESLDSGDLG